MNERTEALINEYLDGTLEAEQRAEVEQLLAESAEAQAYWAELELMFADLAELDDVQPSRDLSQKIVLQLEAEPAAWSNWWLVGQVIGVVLLFVLAWPVLQMGLAEFETAVSNRPFNFSLSFISQFWQQLQDGFTAVTTLSLNVPGLSLGSAPLTWLLATTFLIWIFSNGLLLSGEMKELDQ